MPQERDASSGQNCCEFSILMAGLCPGTCISLAGFGMFALAGQALRESLGWPATKVIGFMVGGLAIAGLGLAMMCCGFWHSSRRHTLRLHRGNNQRYLSAHGIHSSSSESSQAELIGATRFGYGAIDNDPSMASTSGVQLDAFSSSSSN